MVLLRLLLASIAWPRPNRRREQGRASRLDVGRDEEERRPDVDDLTHRRGLRPPRECRRPRDKLLAQPGLQSMRDSRREGC